MREEQVSTATTLVENLMIARKTSPAWASSYPAAWDGDMRHFCTMMAQVAGLSGQSAVDFACDVEVEVRKRVRAH